jgi:hypothetical protein
MAGDLDLFALKELYYYEIPQYSSTAFYLLSILKTAS